MTSEVSSVVDCVWLADLGHGISRAATPESLIRHIHRSLNRVALVSEVRMVAREAAGAWTEWTSGTQVVVHAHQTCPVPGSSGAAHYFDAEDSAAGFLWIATHGLEVSEAMRVVAPQVGTALTLHHALRRLQRASLREKELVQESLSAGDRERQRIAQDLHDDLGQSLVSVKVNLKWVEDFLRNHSNLEEPIHELESARDMIGVVLGKIRDLSHTLYPNVLDTLGLFSAISNLVDQATRGSGIEARCSLRGKESQIATELAIGLYRCCQEALSNAVRHSGATQVGVSLTYDAAEVRVTVQDNGTGFDPRTLHEPGSRIMSAGFWSIRQRMGNLGGAFRVTTAKDRGSVIEVIAPMRGSAQNA